MPPDFLIIGAARSGTTALYASLCRHPGVLPGPEKEPEYFSSHWHQHPFRRYAAQFPSRWRRQVARVRNRGARAVTGEATTYYLFYPHTARRVRSVLPRVRLIALLRNPIDRAYSHHALSRRRGLEKLPFGEATEAEPARLGPELERLGRDERYDSELLHYASYLHRGHYLEQLERWLECFPGEQLLVVRSEDFFADPDATYGQVLRFLGLPPFRLTDFGPKNAADYPPMAPAVRERLRGYFAVHNERLGQALGRGFPWD